jgi:hypothetical protein
MRKSFTLICGLIAIGSTACTSYLDSASTLVGMGRISEKESTFTGGTVISASPAPLYQKGSWTAFPFRLGAEWNSGAPDSVAIVLSYESSTRDSDLYTSFRSLDVNINGRFSSYRASGPTRLSSSAYNNVSKRIYTSSENVVVVPMRVFREMLSAADCRIRINSSDGAAEANFSEERIPGGQATAKFFLKQFLARVDSKQVR